MHDIVHMRQTQNMMRDLRGPHRTSNFYWTSLYTHTYIFYLFNIHMSECHIVGHMPYIWLNTQYTASEMYYSASEIK